MAACPKSRPQNRKRQHVEADLSQDDLPSQPSKKLKSITKHHSAPNFPPEFYDSLSKVWLTPRALRELDRRNQLKRSAYARAPAPKPVRRFSNGKDLLRFARHGGPELGDLRGYLEPTGVNFGHTMSSKRAGHSSRSSHSRQSKSTKSTSNSTSKTSNTEGSRRRSSAYDDNFEQLLIENGIYPKGYEYPDDGETPEPSNLEEIRQRLAMPRPSLSPSRYPESAFRNFVRANDRVIKEGDVMRKVLPTICGNADIPNQEDLLFTRLESITNRATVDAKPDFYDGAPLESIDKQVREDLSPYIIPTGHQTAPVAPNFFIEAKAPKGGADVVKRQITHDLSLGARGMHQLQSYRAGELVFDNNAYTIGATYHAGSLNMYATHVTPTGPRGSPEYHTTQVRSLSLNDTKERYLEGATHLRNGRVQSKEWRDEFISVANERATHLNAEPSTFDSSTYNSVSGTTDAHPVEESQTSVDELAATSFYPAAKSFSYPAASLNRVKESQTSTDDHEEPEPSQDELATSFYPATKSFSYPAASSYRVGYDDLSDVTEELEISADELALDTPVNPTLSKKRLSKGSDKTVSKAPRHNASTSHRKHRSKR